MEISNVMTNKKAQQAKRAKIGQETHDQMQIQKRSDPSASGRKCLVIYLLQMAFPGPLVPQ